MDIIPLAYNGKPNLCPSCEHEFPSNYGCLKGEIIRCPECGMELEVMRVNPYLYQEAPREEEDWGE